MKLNLFKTSLLLLCIGAGLIVKAQETKVYFGLGGLHNAFQDTRFSDVQFSKTTVVPEIGFTRVSDKDYWHANAYVFFYNYDFPNYDTITYSNLGYNVRLGYLRKLKPNFFLGANWDVLDYSKKQTEFLGNSADVYNLSSDFYISGKYIYDVAEDWQFNLGLDIGLFTFVNRTPSFTANYQQNIIDNGGVTFIDSETKTPTDFGNMAFKPFWEQVNIRTFIELNFKRRLSLVYS